MWARLWGSVLPINVKLSTSLEEKYSTKVLATSLELTKSTSSMPHVKVELLGLLTILAWYSHQSLELVCFFLFTFLLGRSLAFVTLTSDIFVVCDQPNCVAKVISVRNEKKVHKRKFLLLTSYMI